MMSRERQHALAALLLLEVTHARLEHVGEGDETDGARRVLRVDDEHARAAGLGHAVDDDAEGLVAARAEGRPPAARPCRSGTTRTPGLHDVAHEQDLERIDRVLAADVEAAARDLLGEDRALERRAR